LRYFKTELFSLYRAVSELNLNQPREIGYKEIDYSDQPILCKACTYTGCTILVALGHAMCSWVFIG